MKLVEKPCSEADPDENARPLIQRRLKQLAEVREMMAERTAWRHYH